MAGKFGQGIAELTTDGSFDKMLTEATAKWIRTGKAVTFRSRVYSAAAATGSTPARYFSTSSAAMQPSPAAVTA